VSLAAEPRVSVIMAMRNNARTIAVAIRSIQAQTLSDWELILIDDGSRDDGVDIAASFGEKRLRLLRDGQQRGLPARLNQAVALARGQYIARMDADDVCFPERLSHQVSKLESAGLDLVGCDALVFAGDEVIGRLNAGRSHDDIVAKPHNGFPLPHPTWFGRAAWFRANPYDERMMKAQDQDLLLRTYRGSRFGAVPEVLVAYRQDRLVLRKMLTGRRLFAGALWRHARANGEYAFAARGVLGHGFKALVDAASIAAQLGGEAQRRRLSNVPQSVVDEWTQLRMRLGPIEDAA
jgi:glycosyltransferase involved in cell wall biosynthesis